MSSADNRGPRLILTADDHRAVLVIVVLTCLIWSILVILARGIWRLHQKSDFGLDDAAATLGTILSVAQAGTTLAAVHFGFGKRSNLVSHSNVTQAGKYLYSASILYVLCMCASRASISLLIARLTREPAQMMWTRVVLGSTLLWGIASVFAIAFECGTPVLFQREADGTCPGLFAAWTAIEALGLLIELSIIAMAIALVANLQMRLKLKIAVAGSFCLRTFLVIPVAFRLDLLRQIFHSTDPFFDNIRLMIVTQLILHYSLWAASFPCMRALLRAFDTGMGVMTHVSTQKGSNYGSGEMKGSYAMKSISREKKSSRIGSMFRSEPTPMDIEIGESVPSNTATAHQSHANENRNVTSGRVSDDTVSESSRKAIITRTVEWQIKYEDAPGIAL